MFDYYQGTAVRASGTTVHSGDGPEVPQALLPCGAMRPGTSTCGPGASTCGPEQRLRALSSASLSFVPPLPACC
jgi:hypothetical protein